MDQQHSAGQAPSLSPIKPGTLCLLVQDGTVHDEIVGRTLTVTGHHGWFECRCLARGHDGYYVAAQWLADGTAIAARTALQPLLPPGLDDQVERAIGNLQLEVV